MLNRPSVALGIVCVAVAGIAMFVLVAGNPKTASAGGFAVNTTADEVDANLADEVCDSDLETAGLQCTLRAAVQQANENEGNDDILVPEGTYTLEIVGFDDDAEKGDLDVTDDVSIYASSILGISGAGSTGSVVQAGETPGSGIDRVFDIHSGVSVEIAGLTVRHGTIPAGRGGGILNRGILTLDRVTVASNSAMDGGGVFNESGSVLLTDSTLEDNSAAIDGGGMYNESGDVLLESVDVLDNRAVFNGAGINSEGNGASLIVQHSTISDNVVVDGFNGGGIDAEGQNGTLDVVDTLITGNTTQFDGGGIYISGNTEATVSSSVVSGNTADSNGGGIYAFAASELTVSGSTVSENDAGANGGGLFYGGTGSVSLTDSTIDGNGAGSRGGGIFSWKPATLVNVTISGNAANGSGGGLLVRSPTTITSSTIAENVSNSDAEGGGEGGALFVEEGTAQVGKSIIARNEGPTSDPDCLGTITSQGYNLIETVSPGCDIAGSETGNITGEDPLLGPLADNGGPTRTHALLADSPAIDAVMAGCPPPAADQRGVSRPQGAACDMGSYEREPGRELIWGDHNCSGSADPVDALLNLRHDAGLPAETSECPEMGDEVQVDGIPRMWGDFDCSEAADPVDALKVLRFDAGLSVEQEEGCPGPGETVSVS